MANTMSYAPDLPSNLPQLSLVPCQPSLKARSTPLHTRIGRDPTALAREPRLTRGASGGYLATASRRDSKPLTRQGNWFYPDVWDLADQALIARNACAVRKERMMKHEAQHEVDLSRRNFLKFGGLLGMAFGALSLPALGWGETSDVTADMAEEDNRLAKKHHKSTSSGVKKVSQAQEQLKAAGFDPGPVDGHMGSKTRAALRDYQAAHHLPKTGKLDRATQKSLMAGTA
jgi:hypothetical protein